MRLLASLLILLSTVRFSLAAEKPNVLFLFTDDQRADTIHALGNEHIITPNFDSLVNTGMSFRNAYCLGSNSGAVCFPSRNMLLSGRVYFRFPKNGLAEGDKPNFADSMKAAGYVTYHHGKKGNTARELHKRFDVSKYLNDEQARTCGEPGQQIVDEAIDFLKADERPFCMYLAFSTPHDPRVAAQKYLDLYEREKIPLPKNYLPLHPFNNGEQVVRDELLAGFPRTEDEVRKHLHDYYAVITGLDGHIGRLLQHLKDSGRYDNTIIILSSDHGLAIGSHGLFGKQNLYEDGMKPPLVVTGPGIKHGETNAMVYLMDIFPTVCDLVGTDIPGGLDGKSFAGVLKGETEKSRETIFLSYRHVQRAVRDDRWKLIRYPQINRSQLFDLRNDPHELHDLSADPEQQERIASLMKQLAAEQEQFGDTQPLTSANPQDPTFTPPAKK